MNSISLQAQRENVDERYCISLFKLAYSFVPCKSHETLALAMTLVAHTLWLQILHDWKEIAQHCLEAKTQKIFLLKPRPINCNFYGGQPAMKSISLQVEN